MSSHSNGVEVRTLSCLKRCIFFSGSHSVVEFLVLYGLLSCCINRPLSSFSCPRDSRWFFLQIVLIKSGIHFSICGNKAAPNHGALPPPCFTVGMRFSCSSQTTQFGFHLSSDCFVGGDGKHSGALLQP